MRNVEHFCSQLILFRIRDSFRLDTDFSGFGNLNLEEVVSFLICIVNFVSIV